MARIVDDKEFLIIESSRSEMHSACRSLGICDYCNNSSDKGYYIAVLNSWYCPKCYNRWRSAAHPYKEDKPIEERNFQYYGKLLGVL